MNWCGSKKLKNVSESVILAYLEYNAKKLRNCDHKETKTPIIAIYVTRQ
jgi:hypothetical protein